MGDVIYECSHTAGTLLQPPDSGSNWLHGSIKSECHSQLDPSPCLPSDPHPPSLHPLGCALLHPPNSAHTVQYFSLLSTPRVRESETQVHRAVQDTTALRILGVLAITSAVRVCGYDVFLQIGLPLLFCHLVGCLFLIIYYKTTHHWRNLTSERTLLGCLVILVWLWGPGTRDKGGR